MTNRQIKRRAEKLARELFTNSNKQVADRLVLTADGRDLGGWGIEPVTNRIYAAMLELVKAEKGEV
jgi:hypothetical protein